MNISLTFRTKLIASLISILLISGVINTIVGVRLIGNGIIKQAQDKVKLDLNSAREIYTEESEKIKTVIRLSAVRSFVKEACAGNSPSVIEPQLNVIMTSEGFDMLTLADEQGRVLLRTANHPVSGDQPGNPVVMRSLMALEPVVATRVFTRDELEKEGAQLVERAMIEPVPTPKAKPWAGTLATGGMMIIAAAPVFDETNKLVGILYGGRLINRNYAIVDRVKDIVYRGERYRGKDIGTATVFQGDLRISTNVMRTDGSRAIGTRVSEEVYHKVIEQGLPWVGRAFVVDAWYITAYEPIKDIAGNIIGMLYVGMLEAPYVDMKQNVVYTFLIITAASVIILSLIAYLATNTIVKPVNELAYATNRIAEGDLTYRVVSKSQDEIGVLAHSFNQMTTALQKANDRYRELTANLERLVRQKTEELEKAQDQIIRSEKLASLGKMAAGIAHEINNPLTSILINSHLIAEGVKEDGMTKESLDLIIDETNRCSKIVKELLEFSRQSPPEKSLEDINGIIRKTLVLIESQIMAHGVQVRKDLDQSLPAILVDANKIEQVMTNIMLNALDAMPRGGMLTIGTRLTKGRKFIEIMVADNGCGISPEHLSKIFDPFFTTKGTKGTGLGLSVSYGIVQQHDGTIDIQSVQGKGTTVIIKFPVKEAFL